MDNDNPQGYITDQQMRDQAVRNLILNQQKQSAGPSPAPVAGTPPPAPDIATSGETASRGDNAPETKITESHPGPTPDQNAALNQYISGQEKQVDAWGPEKQAALYDHIQKGYNSPGNMIAKGGATLADAIMQGVARAGNPGNLEAINQREQQEKTRAMGIGKNLNEANLQGMKEKQRLESMSPTTPLGGSSTPGMKAVAQMYGMTPAQVNALTASNPQIALQLLEKVGEFAPQKLKAEIENEIKTVELQIQQQRNDIEGARVKSEAALGAQGKQIEEQRAAQDAAKTIANGSPIPFVGPSHAQKQAALKTLSGTMGGQNQPASTGPLGPETVRDGKTYVWSPSTGKYHLKQTNE